MSDILEYRIGSHVVTLDRADAHHLRAASWSVRKFNRGKRLYVCGRVKGRAPFLHRLIVGAAPRQYVGFADGDSLNLRRANLLVDARRDVRARDGLREDNASGFKGVCWHQDTGRWRAYVYDGGRQYHLGYHETPEEAARAYDRAALERFGEGAMTNGKLGLLQ